MLYKEKEALNHKNFLDISFFEGLTLDFPGLSNSDAFSYACIFVTDLHGVTSIY